MNFGVHEAIYLLAGVAIGWWGIPWLILPPAIGFWERLNAFRTQLSRAEATFYAVISFVIIVCVILVSLAFRAI